MGKTQTIRTIGSWAQARTAIGKEAFARAVWDGIAEGITTASCRSASVAYDPDGKHADIAVEHAAATNDAKREIESMDAAELAIILSGGIERFMAEGGMERGCGLTAACDAVRRLLPKREWERRLRMERFADLYEPGGAIHAAVLARVRRQVEARRTAAAVDGLDARAVPMGMPEVRGARVSTARTLEAAIRARPHSGLAAILIEGGVEIA
mgnify:CR=1 FL=1